jgi:hypothetical protein
MPTAPVPFICLVLPGIFLLKAGGPSRGLWKGVADLAILAISSRFAAKELPLIREALKPCCHA